MRLRRHSPSCQCSAMRWALLLSHIIILISAYPSVSRQSRHSPVLLPRIQDQAQDPVHLQHDHLNRRGLPGAVYICIEDNFRGDCVWLTPNNDCHIPGTGSNSPKSIGPDPGGFCILYETATCTGQEIRSFRFPGIDSAMPQFSGIKCFADGQTTKDQTDSTTDESAASTTILEGGNAGDSRLAGGIGSGERARLQAVMAKMDRDGFRQGLIGLKKGHYY